jgi:hypothetical protein
MNGLFESSAMDSRDVTVDEVGLIGSGGPRRGSN